MFAVADRPNVPTLLFRPPIMTAPSRFVPPARLVPYTRLVWSARLVPSATTRRSAATVLASVFAALAPASDPTASAQTLSPEPPAVSGFRHVWSDTFDGGTLDASRWSAADTNVPTNNSLQDYRPGQVSVADGRLKITTTDTPSRGLPYTSGLVQTTTGQQHGRWEVRAKLPTGRGMWPAIWLLSDIQNNPWPSQGEIDIMENRGDEPSVTSSAFHYGTNPPFNHNFIERRQQTVAAGVTPNYHNAFHNYAVEWTPRQVRFYVDDVHHSTIHDAETGGFLSAQTSPMNLIINTAVGGNFLDDPDGSGTFPQTLEVEHVHVYQTTAAGPVLSFDNGGFDRRGGSLADWSVFGNSAAVGSNVRSSVENVHTGDGAVKLYGQFNGSENYSGVQQGLTVESGDELFASVDAFIDSSDSIFATDNEAFLTIDYFSEIYGAFGSAEYLGSNSWTIADGSTINDQWLRHAFTAVVPDGAVEARMGLVFRQPGMAGGAVHFDNALFGIVSAVPEPSGMLAAMAVGIGWFVRRRRRR